MVVGDERRASMGRKKGKKGFDADETTEEVEGLRRRRKGVSREVAVAMAASLDVSCGGDVCVGKATEVRKRTVVDTVVQRRL